MDLDEYDYLEKSLEVPDTRNASGKKDGVEKSGRDSRQRKDDNRGERVAEYRSKRSREERDNNGGRREQRYGGRERLSRSERQTKDQYRNVRDAEFEKDQGRERHRERGSRAGEMENEKDKERVKKRLNDGEREKGREEEREREKGREEEREKSDRSNTQLRRNRIDHDNDAEREIATGRSRDMEMRENEQDIEAIENRKFKGKKERIEPEADPERDQRTVFAYQMPLKAMERDIYEFFSKAGKVRDVRLIMDRNSRRSKGVGYVEFYDAMSVPMAIALSGHQLFGQPVMVKPSEAEKNLVQSTASGGLTGGLAGQYGLAARKLYVGNLHFNMTEDQLRQVFEPFGPVELVQLPLDLETGQCKGFGFVQFSQPEHAKAAQSLNGKLEIAGRIIKVSAVTDHLGVQDGGENAADFDDNNGGGLSLNAQSRAMLMQKLDRTGIATSIAGSLGNPLLNGLASSQQAVGLPMNGKAAVPVLPIPGLVVTSQASAPVGNPSECLLLTNMFDPTSEKDADFDMDIKEEVQEECSNFGPVKHVYVDKNSAGHVFLRFGTVEAAITAQNAMHMRWFAQRLISAQFMLRDDYEDRVKGGS